MTDDRIASLDLLRGFAATAVAIAHFWMAVVPGWSLIEASSVVAVEIFFVLSGFVLASQIVRLADGRDLTVFLTRRWMRTVPPYLVALMAMIAITPGVQWQDMLRYATYTQNLFKQTNVLDFFAPAWSLSVEEWFYLVFPALLLAALWRSDRSPRAAAIVTAMFIGAVTVARLWLAAEPWGAEVRRVVVFRIDSIAYGVLLWLAVANSPRLRNLIGSAAGIGVLGTAFMAISAAALLDTVATTWNAAARFLYPFAAMTVGASAILLCLAIKSWIESSPPTRAISLYLGRISYAVYLFHLPVLLLVQGSSLSPFAAFAAYLLVLAAVCTFSYWWFERPILLARPTYRPRLRTSPIPVFP